MHLSELEEELAAPLKLELEVQQVGVEPSQV